MDREDVLDHVDEVIKSLSICVSTRTAFGPVEQVVVELWYEGECISEAYADLPDKG